MKCPHRFTTLEVHETDAPTFNLNLVLSHATQDFKAFIKSYNILSRSIRKSTDV